MPAKHTLLQIIILFCLLSNNHKIRFLFTTLVSFNGTLNIILNNNNVKGFGQLAIF